MRLVDRLRQKRSRNFLIVVIAAAITLILARTNYVGANDMPNSTPVELQPGEKGESLTRRFPTLTKIDRQPAGLNFYSLRWPVSAMGIVLIQHGAARLEIENVISATGTEDVDRLNEGMYEITINHALSNTDKILHDDARLKTHAYLKKILAQGWRVVIPRGMARLRGRDMNNFMLNNHIITTLDPEYLPSLNEWMQYGSLEEWEFYLNGVYLTVQVGHKLSMSDPLKPAVYLLSTIICSEADYLKGYLEGGERIQWKKSLIPKIRELKERRTEMEVELRRTGTMIDEAYADPPLPNLE